ncbi:rap guanine nucleotide exchange factor 1-like isoform X2 [Mugil cephalus]|uniref:rap guanine nucleotide exchange factor 1-like isoform X2 n=1 Tax=Mugil cephalus TaxID=48193 RepID=UPI001FB6BD11|nr:rap guanine nucleotide exchange factor 1-like isoform X2 [Mugil cephalus]
MSSRPESKTASQLVSLTMRLKDKLQTQKIKRSERIKLTPSQRVKPADLNLQQHQSVGVLADRQRVVLSSLQYFKALVDKLGVDRPGSDKLALDRSVVGQLLGGASSRVLEAVLTLVQLEPHLHNRTISACLSCLYRSLAQLIHWTDQVMLQGVPHHQEDKESTGSVTTVIKAVLDNVKELVRLASERQEGSAPLSPIQSPTEDQDISDMTLSPPEDEDKEDECVRAELKGEGPTVLAPPKPPKPLPESLLQGQSPPALPPKKRQSYLGPASCKIAIVEPMRREVEGDSELDEETEDEGLKRLSASSTHFDDPDYDFLHKDLSSCETLPPLPPTLPEKRRRSHTGGPVSFVFESTPPDKTSSPSDDVTGPDASVSSPLSPSKTPPPLPEKKRHIHQYLQFCSSYSDQSAVLFYQRPSVFSQRLTSRQRDLETAQQLEHTHLDTDSAPSPDRLPVPALPQKKKQQDSADNQTEDSSQDLQQEVQSVRRSSQEEQEEVLLTDQSEILHRITMKSEEEDGPDVKAASPEILLVYATTHSSTDPDLYCEAFLCTYRSFMSPDDVVRKLQHRYRRLSEGQGPDSSAATKAFNLLLRVVDQLCTTELDSDLLLLLMELVSSLLIGGKLDSAHRLHSNILSKMEKKWQLIGSPHSLRPLASKGVAARPGTLLDFRSQDLAEQLTLLDSALFYKIELPEVLLWSKEQNEERSPNLTEFTQHFNNMSFWVRSVIILQDKAQDREKLLLKFLKIMKHLRKLNNFNSYLSILSALDSAPLRRLDWQKSTSDALEEFSSLIDSSSSFRAYRAALAEVEPPCIPYLGLILQDLTFVHLGNPDALMTSQGSKVNFSKRWQQFNILETLRSYQQVPYLLQQDDDIMSFFNDFSDHVSEEALWELSLRIRPKNVPRVNQR